MTLLFLGYVMLLFWLNNSFPGLWWCYYQENWPGFDLWRLWRATDSRPVQHGCWEAWRLSRWSGTLVWYATFGAFAVFYGLCYLFDMSLQLLLATEWLHWIIFLWSLGTPYRDNSFSSFFPISNDSFPVKFLCIAPGKDYDFHVSPTDL